MLKQSFYKLAYELGFYVCDKIGHDMIKDYVKDKFVPELMCSRCGYKWEDKK